MPDETSPAATRRAVLTRAAAGIGGGGLLAGLAACGGQGTSVTAAVPPPPAVRKAGITARAEDVGLVLDALATSEAAAVTFLSRLLEDPKGKVAEHADVLEAANAAEYAHYAFLTEKGGTPISTTFWIPDDWFHDPFATIETSELLSVDAYLAALTVFARAEEDELAREAAQLVGVEAEHLAFARKVQGEPPVRDAFLPFSHTTIDEVMTVFGETGLGIGRKGSRKGRFYDFPGEPPGDVVAPIENRRPE